MTVDRDAAKSTIYERIARIAKYFVPPALRPRLRKEYSYIVRFMRDRREKRELRQYQEHGGTYLAWYAKRLNRGANDPAGKRDVADWMSTGDADLRVAVALGLKPHHSFYEFGCGDFRAGNRFIRYLESGKYAANDASGERIKYGETCLKQILGEEMLRQKAPQFFVNVDNSFDWLKGRKFDFLWASAVLPHMPEHDIADSFDNLRKAMHDGSVFLFTYSEASIDEFRVFPRLSGDEKHRAVLELAERSNTSYVIRALEAARGQKCVEVSVKDWFHTFDFYRGIAEPRGYAIEDVTRVLPSEEADGFQMWDKLVKVTLRRNT